MVSQVDIFHPVPNPSIWMYYLQDIDPDWSTISDMCIVQISMFSRDKKGYN